MSRTDAKAGTHKPRLVVLVTHPIQYYAPVYRCIAAHGAIDIRVIYLSDAGAAAHVDPGFGRTVQWDVPLLEGYPYEVLQPGTNITARTFWSMYAAGLVDALERAQPDWLLVYGYASRMNWVAARWARRHHVKVAYASDSNSRNPERLAPIKKVVVGRFFRHIDAFLSPSERNVEYLLRYGADDERVHRIPFAIDVARFALTSTMDETARVYDFIWAGKFIPHKRGMDFIRALRRLASAADAPISACMVGDGPGRTELVAAARELPPHCRVDFPGFVNQGEMPSILRQGQTFVFTSEREAYGLACTEAAAGGMALIVTDHSGCVGATVLAQPGVNALTYHAGDVAALAKAMGRLLRDAQLRTRLQRSSLGIVKYHGSAHAAAVIEHVVSGSVSR